MGVEYDTTVVVAIDFDGTITESDRYPEPMTPVRPEAVSAIGALRNMGCFTVLWTCRCGDKLDEALQVCGDAGIEFDAVNVGNGRRGNGAKVNADYYIDDRACTNGIDWEEWVRHIASDERLSELGRNDVQG